MRGRDLLNRIEGDVCVLQSGLEFRNAAGCIIHHDVQAVAG